MHPCPPPSVELTQLFDLLVEFSAMKIAASPSDPKSSTTHTPESEGVFCILFLSLHTVEEIIFFTAVSIVVLNAFVTATPVSSSVSFLNWNGCSHLEIIY